MKNFKVSYISVGISDSGNMGVDKTWARAHGVAHGLPYCGDYYRVCTGPGKPGRSWNFIMAF